MAVTEKSFKQLKSFEHVSGWDSIEKTVEEVNKFILSLGDSGSRNVDIVVTPTGKGVVFTVTYETSNNKEL